MTNGQIPRDRRFAMLKCGVEQWNSFRRGCPQFVVLNSASLADAQLANADLHCVILMEGDLQGANLSCAIFERAVLRKSNFRGSDLRCAILDGADLCRADLSGADLRGASLASAFLKRTDLTGADLSTARGLTAAQLNDALGDERTRLPDDIPRPPAWTGISLARALG
jgi:uncharacterized protein YjbI with pentapeptide repeats